MFPLLLLLLQLSQGYSLECYQCLDVRNVSECHNVVTCPPDSLCFTEASGVGDQTRFNLTCKTKQDCPTIPTTTASPSPIAGSQTSDCAQCCASVACNHYLCSAGTQSITSTTQCQDDPVFDCQRVSALLNLCADIQHAKTVCRKFCGLCDLVDGGWSSWNSWSACDVTCGNGTVYRSRSCTNPSPAHGGLDCPGSNKQTSGCHLQACPVSGGWSAWSPWGSCSVSCSVGLQRRDRSCSNPYPERFGDHCFGDDKVYRTCFDRACADGGWSAWTSWGTCSATCNGGQQSRTRTCTNPPPSVFGRDCPGNDEDKQICNTNTCREKAVAFSVNHPTGSLVGGSPLFSQTLVNTGSYNQATGKFTCPTAGIYSFSATLRVDSTGTNDVYCYFHVNGVDTAFVDSYRDIYDTSSSTMVVLLNVGDVVYLNCHHWDHVVHSYQTSFNGVLITAT